MSALRNYTLRVWRQKNPKDKGAFAKYKATNISPDMSLLEMLDVINDRLIHDGKEPIAFESDCREGICGACSIVINGIPHGKERGTTACQLHMRHFASGETITLEPWRAKAFPMVKDLVVDRDAFERIQQAGGYVSVNTGSAPDAHSILVHKDDSDKAFDAAACIGCGACVAACKNASASLFVAAKISQLAHLPQGDPERKNRAKSMIMQMDKEGFGSCANTLECEAVCPKEISTRVIAEMNWEFIRASVD
ncbi:MAG: succinate dehydrogenase/fumarate reductase iron-sulfur subunit [Deltaproteobacteria bacterium]|nr:succinate dehydrogenase/fumarate reductase iron-sulfur subunit [Deltaproteobacteria bacterium]